MKEDYNSRKRKIYLDYNVRSTDDLHQMVLNQDKYLDEVIGVIKDILVERHAIFPSEIAKERTEQENLVLTEPEESIVDKEMLIDKEAVRLFMKKLDEKSDAELSEIITKYIDYKPETVEAALILSVDKGLISYNLKELLLEQIVTNFAFHNKKIKQYRWESKNAFIGYVSRFQDEEIYDFIEDPHGMVIDVYHAILMIAKERELISETDFSVNFKQAKLAIRTDFEIQKAEINDFLGINNIAEDLEDEAAVKAETEKYWKCPACKELVGMELALCWNCQAVAPDIIEHPVKEEVLKQMVSAKSFNPFKTGFILIATGTGVGFLDQWRHYSHEHSHLPGLILAGIIVVFGIVIIFTGLFNKAAFEK